MKQGKKEKEEYGGYQVREATSRQGPPPPPARRNKAPPPPKPVDEDLYKISPDLLYARTKKVINDIDYQNLVVENHVLNVLHFRL